MSKIWTVTKKELWTYFSSPIAFIFLFAYLLASLFTFFWVEKFFSRNIADLRPLFQWMPVLLIFLISTLTMKMWSEERRMGTVEFLLTLPVKVHELVIGKFLSCLILVAIALLLTFGLPLTVGILGPVDWGPVFGAYLASLLLAAAYISVGLFISSRSDNQIVSLISTVVVCGILYMIGSETIVNLFGNKSGEFLRMIGTGSRFDAVSRGVMDMRDIYYYLSIVAVFVTLNVYSLEKMKWSAGAPDSSHGTMKAVTGLLVANFLLANVWLYKVHFIRMDMTKNQDYSISEATVRMLDKLQEPLLIRGYFSAKTHPLLAPLVPLVRDYLQEYQFVGGGKIRTEFIDPREHEDLEAEANQKYNIEPVPFQVADRHSASMLSSYFNIVIQYGDQFEVLGFDSLVEIKQSGHEGIDVRLRNLEYDITRSIQKVMHSFNNTDNLFANLKSPVKFVGYISKTSLPAELKKLTADMEKTLKTYEERSNGKFTWEIQDPGSNPSLASDIKDKYGFRPQMMSLFSQETFFFYPTIFDGDKIYSLGVPEDLSVTNFEKNLDATLQRLMPGFLKTVGIYTPPSPPMNPMMMQYGGGQQGKQYQMIQQKLGQNYTTKTVDLSSGVVDPEIDALMVIAPKDLDEKAIFAVDQFLMKGGTVILATSPALIEISRSGFNLKEQESGLKDWLAHYGLSISKELVLDKNNVGFPEIRKRYVQGIAINEPVLAPYPLLVDVRGSGLNEKNAITSGLGQLTMAWASPLVVDQEKNKERTVTTLVKSSPGSWTSSNMIAETNRSSYPELGFPVGENKQSTVMAAMVEGRFSSFFSGKDSPLVDNSAPEEKEPEAGDQPGAKKEEKKAVVTGVIDKSPEVAKIIVFASNEFISDDVLKISGMINGSQYTQSLQVMENALDWATQDRLLLSIRSRGHFARTLIPLTDDAKNQWEWVNYFVALAGLLTTFGIYTIIRRKSREHFRALDLV